MTPEQAIALLDAAPKRDKQSRINPALTEAEAIKIVRDAMSPPVSARVLLPNGHLEPLMEKRVLQVTRNQRRPRL